MYHPSRGGVRGGRDQFNWDDVKADKHRENYLGHSIRAPVGRWQKGKDLHWYAKDKQTADGVVKDEIKRIKEEEDEAMQEMLGLAPKKVVQRQNQLDDREVSELLKRGTDEEESTPSYAAGERVEGLGFAPAPSQTLSGQLPPERAKSRRDGNVVYEKVSPAVPLERLHDGVVANEKDGALERDAERHLDGQASVAVPNDERSDSLSSESEPVSRKDRKKRKEERRKAKSEKRERKREEKVARKQARLDDSSKSRYKESGSERQSRRDKEQSAPGTSEHGRSGSKTWEDRDIENESRRHGKTHGRHHRDVSEDEGQGVLQKRSLQGDRDQGGRESYYETSTGRLRHGGREGIDGRRDGDQSYAEHLERGRERGTRLRHANREESDGDRKLARHSRGDGMREGGRPRHDSSQESDDSRRRQPKHDSREESSGKHRRVRHDNCDSSDDSGRTPRRVAKHTEKVEPRTKGERVRHVSSDESDGLRRRQPKHDSKEESMIKRGLVRHDSSDEIDDNRRTLARHDGREESRRGTARMRQNSNEDNDASRRGQANNDGRGQDSTKRARLRQDSSEGSDSSERRLAERDGRGESRASRWRALHDSSEESDGSGERSERNGTVGRNASLYKEDHRERVAMRHDDRD